MRKDKVLEWLGVDCMLEMNSTYTWTEIAKEYPDLWVIITNVGNVSAKQSL